MAIDQQIFLAADNVVLTRTKEILLIQRGNPPFQGKWALPGGFVETDEALVAASVRELKEETGLNLSESAARFVGVYGTPGRDPRFRTVSVVYRFDLADAPHVKGMDDASDARWFALDNLPELAFDHTEIVADAMKMD